MIDVCFCEPFVISGILPTLGVSTLKSALNIKNITSKIFYPSIQMFLESRLMEVPYFMELLDNIPLQVSEYLFFEGSLTDATKILPRGEQNNTKVYELEYLKLVANDILHNTVNAITKLNPTILVYSFTFGCYNFAKKLFRELKFALPNIKIIVGGSNCDVGFSSELIKEITDIDYVICEETTSVFVELVDAILKKKSFKSKYVTSKDYLASSVKTISNMDEFVIPDFNDYMEIINGYNISKEFITLPYEISRGCWWCQKKPCTMCGFFGIKKNFVIKSPKKVIKELEQISQKYGIKKFRFSDLVQPKSDYLQQLQSLSTLGLNLFWELRPDIDEYDVFLLRNIGVTYAQIGLESLSTEQLKMMNKGTTGIYNIYLLILCASYKIDIEWNYLYGFKNDIEKWYEDVIDIIPFLYHLQPPVMRKVWINKYSEDFNENEVEVIQNFSELETNVGQIFFYQKKTNKNFLLVYNNLKIEIDKWIENFNDNFEMYIEEQRDDYIRIVRIYEKTEIFEFHNIEVKIYNFFFYPNTLNSAQQTLHIDLKTIKKAVDGFVKKKLMLFFDGKYISLAVKNTLFKHTNTHNQPLFLSKDIYKTCKNKYDYCQRYQLS